MGEISAIGLDVAKSVFQVPGVDESGAVVIRRRVGRAKVLALLGGLPPCLVGIEACPSAHYWSRELQAFGHTVRLMPPSYVQAYLKRSKNDANDAAAICEAVTRPLDAVCANEISGAAIGLDVASQSAASNARCCRTRSAGIWPSPASSRPRAVMAWLSCCRSLRALKMIAFHRLRGFVSTFLLART